jgi:hypothetical protein
MGSCKKIHLAQNVINVDEMHKPITNDYTKSLRMYLPKIRTHAHLVQNVNYNQNDHVWNDELMIFSQSLLLETHKPTN